MLPRPHTEQVIIQEHLAKRGDSEPPLLLITEEMRIVCAGRFHPRKETRTVKILLTGTGVNNKCIGKVQDNLGNWLYP